MTCIVAFADLHSNVFALNALLAECERLQPDMIVNLGDIVSGFVDPAATMMVLRSHPEFMTVRGNHDRSVGLAAEHSPAGVDYFAVGQLSDDDRRWLRELPMIVRIDADVVAFHGAPGDDLCPIMEAIDAQTFEIATDCEIAKRLDGLAGTARVFLCGHSHIQSQRLLPDGTLVVNPGSLGWAGGKDEQLIGPWADFAVLEKTDGSWEVSLRHLQYDHDRAIAMAISNGRPDIAHTLAVGLPMTHQTALEGFGEWPNRC